MDYADAAKRHRYQAEEARAKADLMQDGETRDQYLRIADAYDGLAANEERLAGNPAVPIQQKAGE
jgi:hypothetical protein